MCVNWTEDRHADVERSSHGFVLATLESCTAEKTLLEPNEYSIICSCHFKSDDFGRTGQTTGLNNDGFTSCTLRSLFTEEHLRSSCSPFEKF